MSDTLDDDDFFYANDPFAVPLDLGGPAPEAELDGARRFMDAAAWGMQALGMETAADNLARYRSGGGQTRDFGDDEIARHPILLRAEDTNRTEFEGRTFMAEMEDNNKNNALQDLADGQTIKFEDNWPETIFQNRWEIANLLTDLPTYMAFGKTTVDSRGEFEATRNGDRLYIRGTVAHGFPDSEIFDFHAGQPGASQARVLEGRDQAAPFRMSYNRRQDVEAVSEYEPDGRLMLLRSTWGPIR